MKSKRIHISTIALFMGLATPAWAGANLEGAKQIERALEPYFGSAAPEKNPAFTVAPKGDVYTLSFDLRRLQAPFEKFGVKISMTPPSWPMTLTPQKDGIWRVTQNDDFAFSVTTPTSKAAGKSEGVAFLGLFDPALPGFVSSENLMKRLTVDQTSLNGSAATSRAVSNDTRSLFASKASGEGVQSWAVHQTVHDKTQHMLIELPAKSGEAGKPAPLAIDLTFGESTLDSKFDGVRARAILDLWAFALAHSSGDPIKDAPDDLKTRLRAAAPLFDHLEVTSSVKNIAATTPVGPLSLGQVDMLAGLNGLRPDGALNVSLSSRDIALPVAAFPSWVAVLVPTAMGCNVEMNGFDPAHAIDVLIGAIGTAGLDKPETAAEALRKLLPTGTADVKIKNLRLTSKLYELKIDAQMRAGFERKETLMATITAKGLDAVLKSLSESGKADQGALQAWMSLQVATALAKSGPDGTLLWEVVAPPDGKWTVNGAPLGKLGEKL
jgi:hypothetical protein